MAKKPDTNLFDLIKHLSKAEKRYFKLSLSKTETKKSKSVALLFDAIDRQLSYDENELKVVARANSFDSYFPTVKKTVV